MYHTEPLNGNCTRGRERGRRGEGEKGRGREGERGRRGEGEKGRGREGEKGKGEGEMGLLNCFTISIVPRTLLLLTTF